MYLLLTIIFLKTLIYKTMVVRTILFVSLLKPTKRRGMYLIFNSGATKIFSREYPPVGDTVVDSIFFLKS